MITRLEIIQAGRGQYFIPGVWDSSENKGPEGRQRNKESGHACSLRTKGKIRGDNEKSLKGQQKEDH